MTNKQSSLINVLSENVGIAAGRAMREAGYSETSSRYPGRVFQSKGVRGLLCATGLTPELVISSLVEDIKTKKNRFQELNLAVKLLGLDKEKDVSDNIEIRIVSFDKQEDEVYSE